MASEVQTRIQRLFVLIILAFLALAGWQSYWQLGKSDWLLAQPGNRRLLRTEAAVPRGAIYDRDGVKLAWSEDGKRQYADGQATAAVLGYLDPVYGRTGVESAWNLELAGLSRTFGPREVHRVLTGEKPGGDDLVLTLRLPLQQAARDALGDHPGAVVMLDPATGAILALASNPTFDPRTIRQDFSTLRQADDRALRNRATQDLYPPGSSMKVVTASAALMHDFDPATTYTCPGTSRIYGVTVTDFHGESHGTVAMAQALAVSCNNYFARVAVATGASKFAETARAFGFNTPWWNRLPDPRMLPLPLTESSLAPDVQRISQGELAHMGFGQSTVVATPLQMAMVAAAIANQGTLMAPYLVQALRKGGTDQALATFSSVQLGQPVSPAVAEQVGAMMRGVVTHGTGTKANIPGITVCGKTGTAQQTGGEDHAWFIGFATQGTRRVAFAVLVERGGTGGVIAVPIARKVIEAWGKAD